MRRVRSFILILIGAIAGAACGRAIAEMRRGPDAPLIEEDMRQDGPLPFGLRPQDLVPGVVAAFRVGQAPWSWLHIPGWLAAFAVNFAAVALSGDFHRLREMLAGAGFPISEPWQEHHVDGHDTQTWVEGRAETTT